MSQVSTISYPYGTLVWVKVVKRYWWPGIVVDPQTIPKDLLDFVNFRNPIAVVRYEYENKYEVVEKPNDICLYSGPYKNDYIVKGFNLYINQKKGIPTLGKFDMEAFKEDILSMEKRIGGDVNIFETIKKNQEKIKLLINSNFTPSKSKYRKKEKIVKEAVIVVKKSRGKSLPTQKSLPTFKTNERPSIPQPKQNRANKRTFSPPSKVVKLHTPTRTAVTNGYTCHVQVNCTFTTNRYDILKRHMVICKNNLKEVTDKKSPNDKKRKNIKNKSSEAKKIKLQEELLKDWDNDGEDDDVQFDISNVQSTSGVASTIAKVKPTTSEVLPTTTSEVLPTTTSEVLPTTTSEVLSTTTSEVLPTTTSEVLPTATNEVLPTTTGEVLPTKTSEILHTSSEVLPTTTSEVLPTTTSEVLPTTTSEVLPTTTSEVLPTISNEIQETNTNSHNTTFDFNKNDDDTTVVEQRQSKSDCSSTVNVMNDKFELQLSSNIKSIDFETAQNKSLLVEKIEDPSNEPRGIHSNEFTNEIDDQTTELLLEKTVNTLDQINNFESSLSEISNTLNKSDSNILTKDTNISGEPELSGFDSLKKPTSPSKEVHTEIDNSIDIVEKVENNVENMSVQIQNHELFEEKTNDTEIIPNDVEVNQPNDTTIDKNIPIEKSSVDNISNTMDSENETTVEKDGWRFNKELFDEVEQWKTINLTLYSNYTSRGDFLEKDPVIEYNSSAEFDVSNSKKINDPKAPILIDYQRMSVPYPPSTRMEELKSNPNIKALQEAVKNGAVIEIVMKNTGEIFALSN